MKEAEAVYHLMQQHDLTESCMMLGGDSTVSNTGWKEGAIANLESCLVISVIVIVCYTQMNCHFAILLQELMVQELQMLHFQDLLKLLGSVNEMECQPEFKALPGGEDFIILPKNVLYNI